MPLLRSLTLTVALAGLLQPWPAAAGLLRPLLDLMRPALETRLRTVCVDQLAGGDAALAQLVEPICRRLAAPTSRCLVEETDTTGRGLGVLSEIVAGRFGDDSEVVVRRCLARQLGLPRESLEQLPLREIVRRYGRGARP